MKYKTIWKFAIKVNDMQNIIMPKNAEILSLQMQGNAPYLWAMVDSSEKETECRNIETFGTGQPIPCDMGVSRVFLGTYQIKDYVFHVFEYTGI